MSRELGNGYRRQARHTLDGSGMSQGQLGEDTITPFAADIARVCRVSNTGRPKQTSVRSGLVKSAVRALNHSF